MGERQIIAVVCRCEEAAGAPAAMSRRLVAMLEDAGVAFESVADMCGLVASRDPRLRDWAARGDITIFACYPRAVRWLMAAGGAELHPRTRIVNVRTADEQLLRHAVLELASRQTPAAPASAARTAVPAADTTSPLREDTAWKPWFPVIDRDRCTSCMQCLSFCLFDVYAAPRPGRVEVTNPANCKTGCPACARLCPATAIIFPKYHESPINGDEPPPQTAGRPVRVDISGLLGGDVYAAIRGRSRAPTQRFSPRRDEAASRAIRQERLRRKQAALGIPDEVVAALAEALRMRT